MLVYCLVQCVLYGCQGINYPETYEASKFLVGGYLLLLVCTGSSWRAWQNTTLTLTQRTLTCNPNPHPNPKPNPSPNLALTLALTLTLTLALTRRAWQIRTMRENSSRGAGSAR